MLFLACNSFFSAAKIESRTSIRAFFSNPVSQSSSVFIGAIYEVSGTSLLSVSASCGFKSVALKYRQIMSVCNICNISRQFEVFFQAKPLY